MTTATTKPHLSIVPPAGTMVPANDDSAERGAIGCVFIRSEVMAGMGLKAGHFLNPVHRWIWLAIERATEGGLDIDELVVESELQRMGKLEAIGGLSYISKLTVEVPTADNAHTYAELVRAAYNRSRAIEELSEGLEAAKRGAESDVILRHVVAAETALDAADGPRYCSAPARLKGNRDKRVAIGKSLQRYHLAFLDDYLRGIAPGDLTLLGASTGIGKTEIAARIAQANAAAGKRVYMLALEAHEDEIEQRIMYNMLARLVFGQTRDGRPYLDQDARERMNYLDWSLGYLDDIVGEYEPIVEGMIKQKLPTLNTLYRDRDFDVSDLAQRLAELQGKADLVILDHLHYVDSKDENENRAAKEIMKTIRAANQKTGVPAIVVAHLRKRGAGKSALIPDLDDFHGSSEITKIATAAVMLSRATDNPNANDWVANTYITIPKARAGGACPYVAMVPYDTRRNEYGRTYMLGKKSFDGTAVDLLDPDDKSNPYPRWAKQAQGAKESR